MEKKVIYNTMSREEIREMSDWNKIAELREKDEWRQIILDNHIYKQYTVYVCIHCQARSSVIETLRHSKECIIEKLRKE